MFSRRGVVIHPFELSPAWIDTALQLNLNVLALHPPGGANADKSLQEMLEQLRLPSMQQLIQCAESQGLQIEYEMHALSYMMPRNLYDIHPNWFRMNEHGERVADFNLCASSPDALHHLTTQAKSLAEQLYTRSHRYYFWLDDVPNMRCHCPNCQHLSAADQQLICVNAMIEGIHQIDPQGMLAYIAYQDTMTPPKQIIPAPGVFLEYAPIMRCLNYPLADPNCPENVHEFAPLPSLLEYFGYRHSQVLDYWLDNSLLSGWKYPPKAFSTNNDVIMADIVTYRTLGIDSITSFACYLGPDYIALHGSPNLNAYGHALQG